MIDYSREEYEEKERADKEYWDKRLDLLDIKKWEDDIEKEEKKPENE